MNLYFKKNITLEEALKGGDFIIKILNGKVLKVKLKAGLNNGQTIRLRNAGKKIPGGKHGDAFIKLKVLDHPLYKIDGINLRSVLFINSVEAERGTVKIVHGPDGKKISIQIAPKTQNSQIITIENKGLTKKDKTGHIYFQIKVDSTFQINRALEEMINSPINSQLN